MKTDYLQIVESVQEVIPTMKPVPDFEINAVGKNETDESLFCRHVGYYDTLAQAIDAAKESGYKFQIAIDCPECGYGYDLIDDVLVCHCNPSPATKKRFPIVSIYAANTFDGKIIIFIERQIGEGETKERYYYRKSDSEILTLLADKVDDAIRNPKINADFSPNLGGSFGWLLLLEPGEDDQEF